jgi:uncharacterized repeat protein (TIGR01451 family)
MCKPRLATSSQAAVPGGRRQRFADGADGAAHELHGYVLGHYVGAGEASGHLGFPVTDVTSEPDGSTWAKFESGATVTCSPSGECMEAGAPADLSMRITDSPDPLEVRGQLTYVVRLQNAGPGRATRVVLTQDLPSSVTLLSAKPSQGSCKGTDPVTCSLGTVKRGASGSVRLMVRTRKGGTITGAGKIDAREPDPQSGNNGHSLGTVVCTHMGTSGDDVLRGTHGKDVLCGLGGDDTIHGLGGDDLIMGGSGSDVITAGSGTDRIYGGDGADTEYGGWGTDRLLGGAGNDSMNGNQGSDACIQGPGVGPRISCER